MTLINNNCPPTDNSINTKQYFLDDIRGRLLLGNIPLHTNRDFSVIPSFEFLERLDFERFRKKQSFDLFTSCGLREESSFFAAACCLVFLEVSEGGDLLVSTGIKINCLFDYGDKSSLLELN